MGCVEEGNQEEVTDLLGRWRLGLLFLFYISILYPDWGVGDNKLPILKVFMH